MTKQTKAVAKSESNALVEIKKDTADLVLSKVQIFQRDGELHLPANYSAANALKSAWLILQDVQDKNKQPALSVCSRHSIANALLDMVIQGLNPAKKQCYFIAYGKNLTLQRSYFGTKAVALRVDPQLDDVFAEVVYKGDKLVYTIDRGRRVIERHEQKFENIDDDNIVGAYAVALGKDGEVRRSEIMTMDQLMQAWKQSKMYPVTDKGVIKADSTHGKFTSEMAKKTVIGRLAKHIINSSNDADLVIKAAKRTDDDAAAAEAQEDVDEYGNAGEVIDIQPSKKDDQDPPSDKPSRAAATTKKVGAGSRRPDATEPPEMTDEEKEQILAEEARQSGLEPGF